MRRLGILLAGPALAGATLRAQAPPAPACGPVPHVTPAPGLAGAAGVYTLTLVGDGGARAVGTMVLRPAGADTAWTGDRAAPARGRLWEAGSVTVSLAPLAGRLGPGAPPGPPAGPLRLLAFERQVRDTVAAGRPAAVLAASEAPRLAPGQVATGYDALILEVHDIGPGRLRGGWSSPLLRGHGGYFCADRR